MIPSVYHTKSAFETQLLGARLAARLRGGDTVLLFGDLGAGKTQFVKGVAEGLGIADLIKSPTFAYVNRYKTDRAVFYHYDLYRMEQGSELHSLGYDETLHDPAAINVVEWADRLGDRLPARYVRVDFEGLLEFREIRVQFIDPAVLSEDVVEAYYAEWSTPLHVRAHCAAVARAARQIGEAMVRANEIVDMTLLVTSCLLHDMCRLCDFRVLDRAKFSEDVTEEKWNRWVALREKFKGQHHADMASDQLKSRGFIQTAEVIRLHKSPAIVNEPAAFDTPEKMITFYADKRAKHDTLVSLTERMRDGRERHGRDDDPTHQALYQEVERRTGELEKTLFAPLDLSPEDIR